MDKDKDKGKKEDPIDILEKEFHDFQLEWKKFLTNDFHHLVLGVNSLIEQNNKQHGEIQHGMEIMQGKMGEDTQMLKNCVTAIDHSLVTILERLKD